MGKVDFGGVLKRVCLEHVPEVQPGEYVLVHVGFALSQIDEAEAHKVFAFLEGMDQLDELAVNSAMERESGNGPAGEPTEGKVS